VRTVQRPLPYFSIPFRHGCHFEQPIASDHQPQSGGRLGEWINQCIKEHPPNGTGMAVRRWPAAARTEARDAAETPAERTVAPETCRALQTPVPVTHGALRSGGHPSLLFRKFVLKCGHPSPSKKSSLLTPARGSRRSRDMHYAYDSHAPRESLWAAAGHPPPSVLFFSLAEPMAQNSDAWFFFLLAPQAQLIFPREKKSKSFTWSLYRPGQQQDYCSTPFSSVLVREKNLQIYAPCQQKEVVWLTSVHGIGESAWD
jgi:hypothetical protein